MRQETRMRASAWWLMLGWGASASLGCGSEPAQQDQLTAPVESGTGGAANAGGTGGLVAGGGGGQAGHAGVAGGAAGAMAPSESGQGASGGSMAPMDPPIAGDDEYLGLAMPSRGFRLVTKGREVPPGADVEYCEMAELPGSPDQEYIAGTFEVANAAGSHHLIVSAAVPGSAADRKMRELEPGAQVPCIGIEIEFGSDATVGVASTQTRYTRSEYPEGVGIRLFGGQRVVFDYHYYNTSEEPIIARSALAVHTIEPSEDVTVATSFAFTNMTLDTPPGTERTFVASCTLKQDALLSGIARHTHALGTDFDVWYEGGARHGEHLWTSTDWEHDTFLAFDTPALVRAGEGFKFACSFRNEGELPLRFGIQASDEMCILAGAIWSPVPGEELKRESCVITWIDDDGVGHDARDAGGFPKATAEDALACHAGFFGLGIVEGCLGCICDSCSTVMAKCSADPDCRPLLECTSSCSGDCTLACEEEMFAHSSAVGMITQVGECMASQCGSHCAIGGVNAMMP